MAQINQDIEMWAGEDIVINVRGVRDLHTLNNIIWKLLTTADSDDVLLEKTLGNGVDIVVPDDIMQISIDSEDTEELGGNRYYQEIRIWDGYDKQATVLTGRVKINPSPYADM